MPSPGTPGRPRTPGLPTDGPHVFVPPVEGELVTVDGEPGHHLTTVLRVRVGQLLSLADDSGAVWQGAVWEVGRGSVQVSIVDRFDVEPPDGPALRVVQGLPKGRKMDEVVQRLTEVGVDRISPVVTGRSVKRPDGKEDKLLARWRSIARAAAEQSRRARLPVIDPITDGIPADLVGAVLWEEADEPLAAVVDALPVEALAQAGELSLVIGPEGGLTGDEVIDSRLRPASLGATILRTETAGIAAAVLAGHVLGR